MILRVWSFFILSFFLFPVSIISQVNCATDKDIFGSDPFLINGILYSYFPPPGVRGNQYFSEGGFVKGNLQIRDRVYKDIKLNYDLLNQQIVLNYSTDYGTKRIIALSPSWIDEFSLGNARFELTRSDNSDPKIYQVIGTGRFKILYYWHKKLEFRNVTGDAVYVFSKAEKELFLEKEDTVLSFRNNKAFLKLLDQAIRPGAKKFMRNNKIHVKKTSDFLMLELMDYCDKF